MVSRHRSFRRGRSNRVLLGAAVAAAGCFTLLSACQSPMQTDTFDQNWGRYADSVLIRAVADGSLGTAPFAGPTENQGVHKAARVDSPGPAYSADTAVVPAGTPDIGATSNPASPEAEDPLAATTQPMDPTFATLGQTENAVSLTLQDAIARTLAHSLAIKVEAYNPGIKEAQITEALAQFDPVLFGQSQYTNQDEPVNSLTTFTNGLNFQNNLGIRQLLPSGGTAQIGVGDAYRDLQDKTVLTPNSAHAANINLSLSQPLLRGFGSEVNNANIYLAQRDRRIALTQFRRQVIQTLADMEEAYHNLVLARTIAEIDHDLLVATEETYRKIHARQIVDADRVQVKQAEAAVQSRRADLIRAESNVRDASDKLKALINDPELDLKSGILIIPADRPVDVPIAFNVAEQIDIALKQRTELQEARLQIQRADIVVEVARNDLLPKADLTVSTQSNGLDNGFDTAFTTTFDAPQFIDYTAGLKLEVPIGNREAEAVYHRRQLERRQVVAQMLRVAEQVIQDVKTQMRQILTSYRETQARHAATISAREELVAITQKELVEKLTPEFLQLKLDSQQRFADAAQEELQALVNYNIAIMKLEQAKGTLLEYNRIAIDRPPEDKPKSKNNNLIRFMGDNYEWNPGK